MNIFPLLASFKIFSVFVFLMFHSDVPRYQFLFIYISVAVLLSLYFQWAINYLFLCYFSKFLLPVLQLWLIDLDLPTLSSLSLFICIPPVVLPLDIVFCPYNSLTVSLPVSNLLLNISTLHLLWDIIPGPSWDGMAARHPFMYSINTYWVLSLCLAQC